MGETVWDLTERSGDAWEDKNRRGNPPGIAPGIIYEKTCTLYHVRGGHAAVGLRPGWRWDWCHGQRQPIERRRSNRSGLWPAVRNDVQTQYRVHQQAVRPRPGTHAAESPEDGIGQPWRKFDAKRASLKQGFDPQASSETGGRAAFLATFSPGEYLYI